MSVLIKIFRFILSILLIPACVAVTASFYETVLSIRNISQAGLLFILGALSYSAMHLLLFKLDFLYVLAHELTHAAATFFSGGKVMNIKVSGKEGSVKTTTPNLFVTLAPYLVPGYTIFIAVLYFTLSFFIEVARYSEAFIFFVGFTFMFHLAYTAQSAREKQSDLVKSGYLFSLSLIYVVNFLIIAGIISLLFGEISFFDFLEGSYVRSKEFYYSFWRQLFW